MAAKRRKIAQDAFPCVIWEKAGVAVSYPQNRIKTT